MQNKSNLKNVLLLHQGAELYGSDKVFFEVVKIVKENYDVVVVLDSNGPLCHLLNDIGVRVIIHDLSVLRRKYLSFKGILFLSYKFLNNFLFLRKLHKKHHFDLVYTNTAGVILGPVFSHFLKIKHLWHLHEIIVNPKFLNKLISVIAKRWSDSNIVVSNAVKKNICNETENCDNIHVLYNGFDWNIFQHDYSIERKKYGIPQEYIVVLYVGRIHFWKGFDLFVKAAQILLKKNKNAKFLIAGDVFPGYEYLKEELFALIKDNDLNNDIIYLGFVKDAYKIIATSDILVVPSILPDPLPTTVLEGMAAGKAVIGSNIGGIPEMIKHNDSGLLFRPGDVDDLVNKLELLLTNKSVRERLSINALNTVTEKFSLKRFKNNINKKFNKMTS